MHPDMPRANPYGNSCQWNAMCVTLTGLTLWFSYETLVAFETPTTGLVVCENLWGPTTGKHLNWIDQGAKEKRLPREEFEEQFFTAV